MVVVRSVTLLVVVLLGAAFTAPGVTAKPLPRVSVDLSVDAADCQAVVLTANVDWKGIKLTESDYMIEWFAVTSFSQSLGTSGLDLGKRAGKTTGSFSTSTTRGGYFDASIYSDASYSAVLMVVATGLIVGTSNLVPITACVPSALTATDAPTGDGSRNRGSVQVGSSGFPCPSGRSSCDQRLPRSGAWKREPLD